MTTWQSLRIFIYSVIVLYVYHYLTTPEEFDFEAVGSIFFPVLWCFIIFFILKWIKNSAFSYVLFFSISIAGLLHITATQNGMFNEQPNLWLYGLSFFSLSWALSNFQQKRILFSEVWVFGNPLLLITGPIITNYNSISHIQFKRRWNHYSPFVLIGIFFYRVISLPMVPYFELKHFTGWMNLLALGIIFEVFVYFNFAGLSLLVYGLMGLMGLDVPLNFRQPFSSRNLLDFWKGWHISISTVLKTLFYEPTKKRFNSTFAIFVVFISSALWHGVTINFLVWGLVHGLAYWVTKIMLKGETSKIATVFVMILTLILARIVFVQTEFSNLYGSLTTDDFYVQIIVNNGKLPLLSLILGLMIMASEFIFYNRSVFKNREYKFLRIPATLFIVFVITITLLHNTGVAYAAYNQR